MLILMGVAVFSYYLKAASPDPEDRSNEVTERGTAHKFDTGNCKCRPPVLVYNGTAQVSLRTSLNFAQVCSSLLSHSSHFIGHAAPLRNPRPILEVESIRSVSLC